MEEREEKIIGDRRGEGRREYRKGEGKYCRVKRRGKRRVEEREERDEESGE